MRSHKTRGCPKAQNCDASLRSASRFYAFCTGIVTAPKSKRRMSNLQTSHPRSKAHDGSSSLGLLNPRRHLSDLGYLAQGPFTATSRDLATDERLSDNGIRGLINHYEIHVSRSISPYYYSIFGRSGKEGPGSSPSGVDAQREYVSGHAADRYRILSLAC